MNVTYEKLDNVHGKINVQIDEKDYADKISGKLKEIRKTHSEPGFRSGKVPAGLIEKKYGEAVKYDIVNKEISDALFGYITDNKLHVLGNPVPAETNVFDLKNADFDLSFIVGLAPEIDTHVNKDLKVPYYTIEVSDEMIDNQDKVLRRRFGKQEPGDTADDTALVKGIITELDENGNPLEGGVVVENGIVSPQHFTNEDQKKVFAGCHVGDKLVFNPYATCGGNATELASMLNIKKNDVDSHKGDFSFEVKEIIVLKPAELGEEYYKTAFGQQTEIKTEEEYRNAVRNMLVNALANDSNYRFTIDAKKAIIDAVGEFELPDDVLKAFLRSQNEALNDQNIDEEYAAAVPQLRWELIRDAILTQLGVKVEEEDLLATAAFIARQQFAQYGMANMPEEMVQKYAKDILADKKAKQQIVNQTIDMKLYAAVKDAVTVDDKKVSVEEFNKLFVPADFEQKAAEEAAEMAGE